MIVRCTAVVLAVLSLSLPAIADEATPDSQGGRYLFSKQGDGFLRLDTKSGEVALCSQQPVGWACQMAPEDRSVLEAEITRLHGENAALKKDILSRGLPLPAGSMAEPSAEQSGSPTVRLPSDADIDRVVAFVGRVWHRLVEAIAQAQKQVLNKS